MQRVTVLRPQAAPRGIAIAVKFNVTTREPVAGKASRQVHGNGGAIEGGDHHTTDRKPERVNTAVMIVKCIRALTSPGKTKSNPGECAGQADGDQLAGFNLLTFDAADLPDPDDAKLAGGIRCVPAHHPHPDSTRWWCGTKQLRDRITGRDRDIHPVTAAGTEAAVADGLCLPDLTGKVDIFVGVAVTPEQAVAQPELIQRQRLAIGDGIFKLTPAHHVLR